MIFNYITKIILTFFKDIHFHQVSVNNTIKNTIFLDLNNIYLQYIFNIFNLINYFDDILS
jgi:hypothetical protein